MNAVYGNNFGDLWRNSFAEEQARQQAISEGTRNMIAGLAAARHQAFAERQFQFKRQAEAADMALRQQLFANTVAHQTAQDALTKDWHADEVNRWKADQRLREQIHDENLKARQDEIDWRMLTPTAAEVTQEEHNKADAQRLSMAPDLANMRNRVQELDATALSLPTERDVAKGKSFWSFTGLASPNKAEADARAHYAQVIPPHFSVDIGSDPIKDLQTKATTLLGHEKSSLEKMIANLEAQGVDSYLTRDPVSQTWMVRGAPGSPQFTGPTVPNGYSHAAGVPNAVPANPVALPAPAAPALAPATNRVVVIGPDGRRYSLPAAQVNEATRQGYRLAQ